MDTDWTSEWIPPSQDLPEISPETLTAVIELQGGEVQESTRHLFETFEPELRAYFRRHNCQKEEADDLTQTVFIQMLDQIETLKDPASFHFWLFKIAGNYLRNFMRDGSRSEDGFEDLADKARGESESSAFWMRGSFEPNPEVKLTMSETVDQRRLTLRKLLSTTRLGAQTRETLLRRFQGESYEEIGSALGISIGTVGSHLSRASTTLLGKLGKLDLDTIDFDTIDLEDSDDIVADLGPELLMFKLEALEADPAYLKAGILETASSRQEAEESDEETLTPIGEAEDDENENDEAEPDESERDERVVDSPAEVAAVVREDQARGRSRRVTRTVPPAASQKKEPALGRLSEDDLRFPLILLGEAACLDARGFDGDLALKAKLTCAASLLERGRRFKVARDIGEIVRQALALMANGQSCVDKVIEGCNLLRSHLTTKQKGDTNHVNDEKQAHRDSSTPRNVHRIPRSRGRSTTRRVAAPLVAGGGDPARLHPGLGASSADDRAGRASFAREPGPAQRVRES